MCGQLALAAARVQQASCQQQQSAKGGQALRDAGAPTKLVLSRRGSLSGGETLNELRRSEVGAGQAAQRKGGDAHCSARSLAEGGSECGHDGDASTLPSRGSWRRGLVALGYTCGGQERSYMRGAKPECRELARWQSRGRRWDRAFAVGQGVGCAAGGRIVGVEASGQGWRRWLGEAAGSVTNQARTDGHGASPARAPKAFKLENSALHRQGQRRLSNWKI